MNSDLLIRPSAPDTEPNAVLHRTIISSSEGFHLSLIRFLQRRTYSCSSRLLSDPLNLSNAALFYCLVQVIANPCGKLSMKSSKLIWLLSFLSAVNCSLQPASISLMFKYFPPPQAQHIPLASKSASSDPPHQLGLRL